ncbi:ATP-binding protein [Chloroflexota bacterium]
METKVLRKIVKIDEELCNGCGVCVPSCAEGAIQIIDGKARLISEKYCDGLGACLGECPLEAITIEEREVVEFDEEAVNLHLAEDEQAKDELPCGCPSATVTLFEKQAKDELPCGCPSATVTQFEKQAKDELPCGCPSATITQFKRPEATGTAMIDAVQQSMLTHWPVQLTLVPPAAPFLQGADLVLVADCVPFAYAGFHQDFLKGRALLVACPKLDDFQAHLRKLIEILKHAQLKSLTVVIMEVPCCSGLAHMAKQAIQLSGKDIPLKEVIIGVRGDIQS